MKRYDMISGGEILPLDTYETETTFEWFRTVFLGDGFHSLFSEANWAWTPWTIFSGIGPIRVCTRWDPWSGYFVRLPEFTFLLKFNHTLLRLVLLIAKMLRHQRPQTLIWATQYRWFSCRCCVCKQMIFRLVGDRLRWTGVSESLPDISDKSPPDSLSVSVTDDSSPVLILRIISLSSL